MNKRNQLLIQFKDMVVECKTLLERNGWGVVCNDFYIGISGYKQKTKTLRSEQIVSFNIFHQILDDGSVLIDPTFEVKTYWTTKRTIYTDIDVAFEYFINETKKFNPKTILWSQIDDEMIQIERGVPGWKLIRKKPSEESRIMKTKDRVE